jgi:hypothetical protein
MDRPLKRGLPDFDRDLEVETSMTTAVSVFLTPVIALRLFSASLSWPN